MKVPNFGRDKSLPILLLGKCGDPSSSRYFAHMTTIYKVNSNLNHGLAYSLSSRGNTTFYILLHWTKYIKYKERQWLIGLQIKKANHNQSQYRLTRYSTINTSRWTPHKFISDYSFYIMRSFESPSNNNKPLSLINFIQLKPVWDRILIENF